MKKLILLIFIWCSTTLSFSQSTIDTLYHYTFKLSNINTFGDAKLSTNILREVTGEMLIEFNDDTDTFLLKSRQYFVEADLFELIENSGFIIEI